MTSIPAVWRIDVEPDDFQPGPGQPPWTGFAAAVELVERLRAPLEDLSGAAVHPTWFFRLDPDIARAYGRADYVMERYRAIVERLIARGDPFGIHVHLYRWDADRQRSYSEHTDAGWMRHCFEVATEAFERAFGEPARRTSQGGYFLTSEVLDQAVRAGIEVDVTPEPGLASQHDSPTFGAYTTAATPDYTGYPRRPYFPSAADPGLAASPPGPARPIMLVPLTAYDYRRRLAPWHIKIAKTILRRPMKHQPLSLHKAWPAPGVYWDMVERAVDEGPARYFAFAVRTDAPGSLTGQRAHPILEHLPRHRLARLLRFVDPLSPEIRDLAVGRP